MPLWQPDRNVRKSLVAHDQQRDRSAGPQAREGFPELFDAVDAHIVHPHNEIAGANAFAAGQPDGVLYQEATVDAQLRLL